MASHPVEESSLTVVSDATDRPSGEMLCDSGADRERARPLAQRLAALLAHQDRLLTAAQAAVNERERELEMARLELRAAEYARDVLERKARGPAQQRDGSRSVRGGEEYRVLEVERPRPREGPSW